MYHSILKTSCGSISLHKSFITNLLKETLNIKTIKSEVIIPGKGVYNVLKPSLKTYTDRGTQLVVWSNFKKGLLNNKIDLNMRLDLALFYLKISTSLKESKFLIKKGLIYVNQIKITKADFKLDKFSIIEIKGDNNKQVLSYVKHEINDLLGNTFL